MIKNFTKCFKKLLKIKKTKKELKYGDGNAGKKIVKILEKN